MMKLSLKGLLTMRERRTFRSEEVGGDSKIQIKQVMVLKVNDDEPQIVEMMGTSILSSLMVHNPGDDEVEHQITLVGNPNHMASALNALISAVIKRIENLENPFMMVTAMMNLTNAVTEALDEFDPSHLVPAGMMVFKLDDNHDNPETE